MLCNLASKLTIFSSHMDPDRDKDEEERREKHTVERLDDLFMSHYVFIMKL